jgi:hypothetical protein
MPWEIYEKVVRRSTSPTLTISKLGRMTFNAAATEVLKTQKASLVLLMWDKEARKIGVRLAAKKDAHTIYTVNYAVKNNSAGFAAKTFLRYISYDDRQTKAYPCEWDPKENAFVVEIPKENFIHRFPRLKADESRPTAKAATP